MRPAQLHCSTLSRGGTALLDSALLIKGNNKPHCHQFVTYQKLIQGGNIFLECGPEYDGTQKDHNEIETRKQGQWKFRDGELYTEQLLKLFTGESSAWVCCKLLQ